jgi:hypothetical protein
VTTNNYILARWRDVITDPPPSGWCGLNIMANGARYYGACGHIPGDQWLDVTAIPGVARTQVQAAVDGIESRRCAIPGQSYDPHRQGVESGLAQGLRELRNHTGVTPKEVTNG